MPDNWPPGDLIKLAQVYTQHRLDAKGGQIPLSKQELQALWRELSAKYPEEFTVSPKAAVEWRIEQIQSASAEDRPIAVAFHRHWLAAELAEAGWQAGERGNEEMQSDNYLQRLCALALHGRHGEAVVAADALVGRWTNDAQTLYGCTRVLALAAGAVKDDTALAERYAARAVALLRQAAAPDIRTANTSSKTPISTRSAAARTSWISCWIWLNRREHWTVSIRG